MASDYLATTSMSCSSRVARSRLAVLTSRRQASCVDVEMTARVPAGADREPLPRFSLSPVSVAAEPRPIGRQARRTAARGHRGQLA